MHLFKFKDVVQYNKHMWPLLNILYYKPEIFLSQILLYIVSLWIQKNGIFVYTIDYTEICSTLNIGLK